MRVLAVVDIDGVLVDSKMAVYQSYAETMNLSMEVFTREVWQRPWEEASKNLGLLPDQAQVVHERKHKAFHKYASLIKPDPLAVSILMGFFSSSQVDIVLATGGTKEATTVKLHTLPQETNRMRVLTRANKRKQGFWRGLFQEYPGRIVVAIDDDPEAISTVRKAGGVGLLWTR